jgi:hypothetical protein
MKNTLGLVLFMLSMLSLNGWASEKASKTCMLGESCQVSEAYDVIIPITREQKATYKCHVGMADGPLQTQVSLHDDAWWFDYKYYAPPEDVIIKDELSSQTGYIKVSAQDQTRFRGIYFATSSTGDQGSSQPVTCAKSVG